jgi:hypothetical protein
MKTAITRLLTSSSVFLLLGCRNQLKTLSRRSARWYSPTELWDSMLGDARRDSHDISPSGPKTFSHVRIKGLISRIELPDPKQLSSLPALIFDVDRSSLWNGITLRGSVRAPIKSNRAFAVGEEVLLTCEVGAGVMPYVYMLSCEPESKP